MMKQKILFGLVFLVSTTVWDVHAQDAATKAVKWLCSPENNRPSGVTVKMPAKGGLLRFFVGGAELDVHINQKEIEELRLKSYTECVTKALPHFKPIAGGQPPAPRPNPTPPVVTPPSAEIINNRYQILANGAEVKDVQTNLIWQRCQVGMNWNGNTCTGESKQFNFDNAQKQAGNGWRVPTIRELSSLIYCSSGKMKDSNDVGDGGAPIKNWCDGDYTKPTINTKAFPNTPNNWVWSSSPYVGYSSVAWFVYFSNGNVDFDFRHHDGAVRLVR